MNRLLLSGLLCGTMTLLLAGCGQTGPLYLPDQAPKKSSNNPFKQKDTTPAIAPADGQPTSPPAQNGSTTPDASIGNPSPGVATTPESAHPTPPGAIRGAQPQPTVPGTSPPQTP